MRMRGVGLGVFVLVCFFVGACTSKPKPPDEFLAREVVVADPGWNQGEPLSMDVSLEAFAAGLESEKRWEAGDAGAWRLVAQGSDAAAEGTGETAYVFESTEEGGANAVRLAAVRQGTKPFTPKEIWSVASHAARKAREGAGK